ncbi:MAG: HAD family hydrolase [Gemmataceae bacterium]
MAPTSTNGRLHGVIFDMDGVLVDSLPFIKEASRRYFAEQGFQMDQHDFDPFVGAGESSFIAGIAAKYGLHIDTDAAKARIYQIYLETIQGRLQPLPGVYTFLDECKRRGLKRAVASSADHIKVEGNLHVLRLTPADFDALVDGSEVQRKKPAPDIFLAAAQLLDLPPDQCLVIEDAINGVAAAKAAGAWCLALTTSFPADRLTQADWTAPNLAHVPKAVYERLAGGDY